MEVILAVLRPKQNISSHDYRPKLYEILLLDHKTQTADKVKPTKYLPAFQLTNSEEEPRDEVLTNLFHLTGGDHHGGIKGERALMIPWNRKEYRESLSRFCLYCVPVNAREKLSRNFVEKSEKSPGFYSLDNVIDTLNNSTGSYRPPTRTFISQLESWLKDKHTRPGSIDILFRNRAEFRVKYSVNNPAFLPSRFDLPPEQNGIITNETPEEVRLTANEALAKMLAIEKCEIVKINPLFGSGLPYKTKVNNVVTNLYWGATAPDYDTVRSRRSSTASSIEGYHINLDRYRLHKLAADGNVIAVRDFIKQGYSYTEQDPQGWTPMHWASWQNQGEVIKVLLENGCSPNIANNQRDTPLHIAARYGHLRVAEILLRRPDINLELLDKDGKTALSICEQKRSSRMHQQIANLLRSFFNQSSPTIPVYLMDGSMKILRLANGDNTTVQQLNLQLLNEYGLPERPYEDIFTIWICSESLELQLKQEHKPMEHLVSWKRRIVGMLTEGDPTKEDPILKWRRNAKIGLEEERDVKHPEGIHLLFHEAYQNYIRALYPCKDQDVLTFASILIYMKQKEFDVSAAKSYLTSKNLPSLVPAPMLKAKSSNWSTRIHHHYKEFGARIIENAELRHNTQQLQLVLEDQFLNFCRNLTVYGSAFFTGNLQSQQGRTGHNQTPCHIGVNDVGIHIINSQTRVMLQSFKYTEIEWRLPEVNSLEIKVVRLENKADKSMSRNMFLKIRTKQAGLIDHLMKKLAQMHAARDRTVDLIYIRH